MSLGKDTLEILPKIYGFEDDYGESKKSLIHMLAKTNRLKIFQSGQSDLNTQNLSLLDLFIQNFSAELFKQIHRGLIRTYVWNENNLGFLKGKIVFKKHMKKNLIHKERIYCRYTELTEDNEYNQVFKFVVKKLRLLARSNQTKKRLYELSLVFDKVSDKNITVREVDSLPINRLVSRYESLLKMARMFLAEEFIDVYSGSTSGVAILFNMNILFEEFIAQTLRKIVARHKLNLKIQGPREFLMYDNTNSKGAFQLKPDLAIIDPDKKRVVAVLDTKWKKLDPQVRNYGIAQSDIYQMQAYAKHYQCRCNVLIYPYYSNLDVSLPAYTFHSGGEEISVKTLDITGISNVEVPCMEDQLEGIISEIKEKYISLN